MRLSPQRNEGVDASRGCEPSRPRGWCESAWVVVVAAVVAAFVAVAVAVVVVASSEVKEMRALRTCTLMRALSASAAPRNTSLLGEENRCQDSIY